MKIKITGPRVIRGELNGNKTGMSIWFFKRKRDTYGRLIKNKYGLCAHGVM